MDIQGAETARLRAEVTRLGRRVEELAGEMRALRRRSEAAPIAAHQVVRRAEAAALLGVKVATLAAWACDGGGPPYVMRAHRAWYRLIDIETWQQQATTAPRTGGAPEAGRRAEAPLLPGL